MGKASKMKPKQKKREGTRNKIMDTDDRQRISCICTEESQNSGAGHIFENIIIGNIPEI